ncbi:MAG: hypothetical protein OEL66_06980 [Desulfobulbaceae bacterium]|nr:hypothetical protein [Desulfobulbaceae bacterium]
MVEEAAKRVQVALIMKRLRRAPAVVEAATPAVQLAPKMNTIKNREVAEAADYASAVRT